MRRVLHPRGPRGRAAWKGALLALALAAPVAASSPDEGENVEQGMIGLDGMVISALSLPHPEGTPAAVWLLVRSPRDEGSERSLWRFDLGASPRVERVAGGLPAWMQLLAASDLGAGLELVAGGEGRLAALGVGVGPGPASAGTEPFAIAPRDLLEDSSFAPRAPEPGLLQRSVTNPFLTVAPAEILRWVPDGRGGLRRGASVRLPFTVTRDALGLNLSSPRVQRVIAATPAGRSGSSDLFLGPEAVGKSRLRGRWIDLAATEATQPELWAALPGPESVSQSWAAKLGSTRLLIVRTQAADELNIFERQRLRVLTLTADRTRSGAPPTLAVELDSKRWHDTGVGLGDVDRDGEPDLVAAFPEGLSGTDLVVQWWRGLGGGRFETSPRRSDLEEGGGIWSIVPPERDGEAPAILLYRRGRLELQEFATSGRKALQRDARLVATFEPRSKSGSKRGRNVTGRSEGATAVEEEVDFDDVELLGAIDLDGVAGPELLALVPGPAATDRLAWVRQVIRPESRESNR